jgi:uroporphyrinogen-III synthase
MNLFLEELQQGKIGAVLFTSSRSVSNLLSLGEKIIGSEMMHSLLTRCMIAAIGPVTADALKMQNVRLDFVSERSVINDAIKRLVETYDLKHEIQISA